MKKIISLISATFLFTSILFCQDRKSYSKLIEEAQQLFDSKEYLKAGLKYSEAFSANGNKGLLEERYNSACAWALAIYPDSSFVQLFKIVIKGKYTNLEQFTKDTDLDPLHSDKRWNELLETIKENKINLDKTLDKKLVATLDTVYNDDQNYRLKLDSIVNKSGYTSSEFKIFRKISIEKDSINLIKVEKILDERGWLGADIVGQEGNTTMFLVIQHADLKTQEKYLPMVRDAVSQGNAYPAHLAMLEDRVAIRQGKRQIYGSQIDQDPKTGVYYVLPLEDPDNVDKRREPIGLGKMEDYVSNWGLTWDVEAYKKQLPLIEAKQKK
ncbi:MAG: DUF6624 domain-containing protein [Bacteroidota bacterium]